MCFSCTFGVCVVVALYVTRTKSFLVFCVGFFGFVVIRVYHLKCLYIFLSFSFCRFSFVFVKSCFPIVFLCQSSLIVVTPPESTLAIVEPISTYAPRHPYRLRIRFVEFFSVFTSLFSLALQHIVSLFN